MTVSSLLKAAVSFKVIWGFVAYSATDYFLQVYTIFFCLQILNHLPLAYLGATSQLHCILGLLLLLHHQKKTLFSHNSLATVITKKSISDISDKNGLSKGVMPKHSSKYFNRMFILSSSKENLTIENNVVDPKTGRGLVGVHGQAQGKLGDELCRLLTVLFDASAGTSVFRHISPTVLLNCLVALCLKVMIICFYHYYYLFLSLLLLVK